MRLVKGARSVDSEWKSVVGGGGAEAGGTGGGLEKKRRRSDTGGEGGSSRAFGLGDPRNRDAAAMRTQMQTDAGAGLPPRTASSLLQR